jgi:FkbM family methyltransferase
MKKNSLARKIVRTIRSVVGQKQFYRAVRLLMYEARFDVLNDPASNGESYLQRTVLRFASNGMVFDVGANVGDWTTSLLQNAHSGIEVHAFEPSAGTFEMLQKRCTHFPFVTLIPMACSDVVGTAWMIEVGAGAGTNALTSDPSHASRKVSVTTIDSYCQSIGISHIDLLKIDAEGHDFNVMLGTRAMLESHRIEVIQFEYNHRWISSRRVLKDAFDLLVPLGYAVGKLTGNAVQFYPHWHWELETYREGNYVACLPGWQSRFREVPASWIS